MRKWDQSLPPSCGCFCAAVPREREKVSAFSASTAVKTLWPSLPLSARLPLRCTVSPKNFPLHFDGHHAVEKRILQLLTKRAPPTTFAALLVPSDPSDASSFISLTKRHAAASPQVEADWERTGKQRANCESPPPSRVAGAMRCDAAVASSA